MLDQNHDVSIAVPSKDVLERILEQPLSFDEETLKVCERVVAEGLTAEEVEIAAQSSYVYWAWGHLVASSSLSNDKDERFQRYRRNMALLEVKRHYSNRKKTYQMLLTKVKKAVANRKKNRLHLLRVCCNLENNDNLTSTKRNKHTYITVPLTQSDFDHCVHINRLIRKELSAQTNVLFCLERQQMAAVRLPRSQPWVEKDEAEGYPWGALYLTERALAMHEVLLDAGSCDRSLHIVLDTYQAVHAPRLRAMTNVLQTMQLLYPERLGKAFIIHPPLWLRTLVNVLKPFLSPHTAERVVMVTKLKCATSQPEDIIASWVRSKEPKEMQEIMEQQMAPDDLYYEPYDIVQQPEQQQ